MDEINEIFVLLGTLASAGWLYLWFLCAVGVGLMLFDRRPRPISGEQAHPAKERMAA